METTGALSWRKSSYSSSNGGNCVEVVSGSDIIAVRDSKNPAGTVLTVTLDSWRAFTRDTRTKNYTRG